MYGLSGKRYPVINSRNTLVNQIGDILRRLGTRTCQRTDFAGDNGKPFSMFSGTRCLNRSIECKKIGLLCDTADHFDNICNFVGLFANQIHRFDKIIHLVCAFLYLLHRISGKFFHFIRFTCAIVYRVRNISYIIHKAANMIGLLLCTICH